MQLSSVPLPFIFLILKDVHGQIRSHQSPDEVRIFTFLSVSLSSVVHPACLPRIRIFLYIPDPHPFFSVYSLFLSSCKYDIPDQDLEFLPIPDPGV